MKQLIHIHGGESWESHDEYMTYLRAYEISDPTESPQKKWRKRYDEFLGDGWTIMSPQMPNPRNATYEEWVIWFEKYVPYMRDGVVCVGSSLGATFLAKYLSENTLPVRIGQLHLAAGRFFTREKESFVINEKFLRNIEPQCEKIFIYHSTDDPIVPLEDSGKFKQALPEAVLVIFEDRGHFLQEEFPELIENIKK